MLALWRAELFSLLSFVPLALLRLVHASKGSGCWCILWWMKPAWVQAWSPTKSELRLPHVSIYIYLHLATGLKCFPVLSGSSEWRMVATLFFKWKSAPKPEQRQSWILFSNSIPSLLLHCCFLVRLMTSGETSQLAYTFFYNLWQAG